MELTSASLHLPAPTITSGFRSSRSQARVMAANWNRKGGLLGGTNYLLKLYKNKRLAKTVGEIFEIYGTRQRAVRIAARVLQSNVEISSHMKNPAQSLDIRKDHSSRLYLTKLRIVK